MNSFEELSTDLSVACGFSAARNSYMALLEPFGRTRKTPKTATELWATEGFYENILGRLAREATIERTVALGKVALGPIVLGGGKASGR